MFSSGRPVFMSKYQPRQFVLVLVQGLWKIIVVVWDELKERSNSVGVVLKELGDRGDEGPVAHLELFSLIADCFANLGEILHALGTFVAENFEIAFSHLCYPFNVDVDGKPVVNVVLEKNLLPISWPVPPGNAFLWTPIHEMGHNRQQNLVVAGNVAIDAIQVDEHGHMQKRNQLILACPEAEVFSGNVIRNGHVVSVVPDEGGGDRQVTADNLSLKFCHEIDPFNRVV